MNPELLRKYANLLEDFDDEDGPPGMIDQPDIRAIEDELADLEETLHQAIRIANHLRKIGRSVSGPFDGQIDSYLIPWLRNWIEDGHQPGSIASLRRILDQN